MRNDAPAVGRVAIAVRPGLSARFRSHPGLNSRRLQRQSDPPSIRHPKVYFSRRHTAHRSANALAVLERNLPRCVTHRDFKVQCRARRALPAPPTLWTSGRSRSQRWQRCVRWLASGASATSARLSRVPRVFFRHLFTSRSSSRFARCSVVAVASFAVWKSHSSLMDSRVFVWSDDERRERACAKPRARKDPLHSVIVRPDSPS